VECRHSDDAKPPDDDPAQGGPRVAPAHAASPLPRGAAALAAATASGHSRAGKQGQAKGRPALGIRVRGEAPSLPARRMADALERALDQRKRSMPGSRHSSRAEPGPGTYAYPRMTTTGTASSFPITSSAALASSSATARMVAWST